MFTAIVGWGSGRGYINFCPEVSFDRFGRFASGLTQYYNAQEQSDEQERDSYKENIPAWRANWSSITAMHYTECPLYSMLGSPRRTHPAKVLCRDGSVTAFKSEFMRARSCRAASGCLGDAAE
jgi:hypothetical protein